MPDSKCPGELVEMWTHEGVHVDFCSKTGGILFDTGEAAFFFELKEDLPALVREDAVATGRTWSNPKTPEATMVEYAFPNLDGLLLDICEQTGAIWFDRGEVQKFTRLTANLESPVSRLVRCVQQLESRGYQVLGTKTV
jgi:Zn-finger nucleic acid-binding protein